MCLPAQAGKRWLALRWAGPDETERGESEALIPAGDKQSEGSYFLFVLSNWGVLTGPCQANHSTIQVYDLNQVGREQDDTETRWGADY